MQPKVRVVLAALLFLLAGGDDAICEVNARLNQVGFPAHGAKRAVIAAPQTAPIHWTLVDGSGDVRAAGRTNVFGHDPASGEHLHRVDFSDFESDGDGYRLIARCAESYPFSIGDEPYGRLKYHALAYFYHNRSGVPIEPRFAGGEAWARPAGHARETATCRSGIDRHGNRWPGCRYTLDLTGGWYDAGDHGKYVVNGGIAVWTLMNFYERQRALDKVPSFADGTARLPEAGNGVNDLLDEARFELEFLLRMQAPAGATARVPVGIKRNRADLPFTDIDASGMAHHKIADEYGTPLPVPPHLDKERRVLYPVSTAATLNLAATAAQCARIWRELDPDFAERCLAAASRAYDAARRNPNVYFIAEFSGSGMYEDSDLTDEFFWAAAELFVTTGDPEYYAALRGSGHFQAGMRHAPAWPRVAALGTISLALVPNALTPEAVRTLRRRLVAAAARYSAERDESGYGIPFASREYRWGSNGRLLNRAIVLALAYDFTGHDEYRSAVIDVMDYLLGRNPLGRSFISGYGERPFRNPHHRFWAHSLDASLPPPPPGVLSGG
ncbi:MAG TPA: glycoside hydrolase family 9 protein, partial [Woeseiaceae bacterium]|nr:glycoside hydrolase family 9 protein [Woeseiaceae bacterium]